MNNPRCHSSNWHLVISQGVEQNVFTPFIFIFSLRALCAFAGKMFFYAFAAALEKGISRKGAETAKINGAF